MWSKWVTIALALTTASTLALAQPRDDGEFLERRLEIMSERLDLEHAQTEELRQILESQHQAMQQLHEQGENRIRGILTSEQAERLTEMQEQRRGKREAIRNRRNRGEDEDERCPMHDKKPGKRGKYRS